MCEVTNSRYTLRLAGIPQNGNCLVLSLIHQEQLEHRDFPLSPQSYIRALRLKLSQILVNEARASHDDSRSWRYIWSQSILSESIIGNVDVLRAFGRSRGIGVNLYFPDGHRILLPPEPGCVSVYSLYYQAPYFDSVLRVLPVSFASVAPDPTSRGLKMATWNLRGALNLEKRLAVDDLAKRFQLDVLCVQETHLTASVLETPNYEWLLGSQVTGRASRGCGFLISKGFPFAVEFRSYSVNICQLKIKYSSSSSIILVCVHRLSNGHPRSSIEAGELNGVLRALPLGSVLLCGDFNAHIGKDSVKNDEELFQLVGPNLLHELNNANGDCLLVTSALFELQILTTIRHRSTVRTWYQNGVHSQIDHVLKQRNSDYFLSSLRGYWSKLSDHKLIYFRVSFPVPGKLY